jgi:UDP-glucose 4-epimerase
MQILVSGGSGRIGRLVVAELLQRGDAVVSLDLQPCGRTERDFREVLGRFDDPAAVEAATTGAGAVLHLGALMSWVRADVPKVYAANVTGTFNVLQAALKFGVRKLVFASSGEVYPETKPVYLPLDESHPTRPTSAYGLSKLLGEEMVEFHQRVHGLPSVILRFSHTQDARELLDPGSFFSGPRFYLRARIRQQEAFGNTKVVEALRPLDDGTEKLLVSRGEDGTVFRMPIADSRDICAGVLQALDSDRAVGQVMNLGPDEAVSFDHAVAVLHKVTGLPVVEARLPIPAVDYVTSRSRARETLDYRTRWSFEDMVADAAERRGC